MALNVIIEKKNNETNLNMIRRFSRKVRTAGFVREKKSRRFFVREDSDLRRQRGALAKMETRAKYAKLRKLGKIA